MGKGRQRTLCVDFDGVIHSYASEFQGATVIPDPPVPGAFDWLTRMVEHNDENGDTFKVCIYSSRSLHKGAIDAMRKWFHDYGLPHSTLDRLEFPTQKPAAFLLIDDRAFHFVGRFPGPKWIIGFRSWIKGGDYNTAEKRLISDLASRQCEGLEGNKCGCLPCRARHLINSESA